MDKKGFSKCSTWNTGQILFAFSPFLLYIFDPIAPGATACGVLEFIKLCSTWNTHLLRLKRLMFGFPPQ
jgi:hypothetical protein